MAKKTAPPPSITIDQAIAAALEEQESLEREKSRLRASLDQLESERSSITSDMQQCAQARASLKSQIAANQEQAEKQESYVSLWQGNAGTQELRTLKNAMEALLDQLHAVMENDAAMTARSNELDTAIAATGGDLASLDKHIQTVASARARLVTENATAIYEECGSVLSERERHAQALREELAAAEEAVTIARGATLQRLSPYPDVRRRFEAEHRLNDDSTSETLQAAVTYADALLHAGAPMEQQPAGSVCVQVWYELVLDAQPLRALANGDSAPLRAIRDRQYSLLYDYRMKQSRV